LDILNPNLLALRILDLKIASLNPKLLACQLAAVQEQILGEWEKILGRE
jgi:hypothetical protein